MTDERINYLDMSFKDLLVGKIVVIYDVQPCLIIVRNARKQYGC